jgi:hypothetical protein
MMFLDCPAYLDQDGATRCGLPAEVSRRFIMRSTDGPMESAMIRCPAGHWFNGPIEFLTWDRTDKREPGTAADAPSTRRDSLTGSHDRTGGPAVGEIRAEPEPDIPCPTSAPSYYLGRPARLWITAMRPGGRRTASDHPIGTLSAADGQRHPGTGSADSHALPRGPGQPERTAMPVPERRSA